MRRTLFRLALAWWLWLLVCPAAVAQIGPVDAFTDLNGTTAGTTLTGSILNTGTHGDTSGSWGVTSTGLTAATHVSNCGLLGSVQVDGTVYTTSNVSLAVASDNTNAVAHYVALAAPSAGYTKLVALVCFTPNVGAIGGSGIMDIVRVDKNDGTNEDVQLSTANCAGSLGIDLETVAPGTSATGCISVTNATSIWIALLSDNSPTGIAKLALFDTSGTQIGSTLTLAQGNASTISGIRFGNSQTGTSTGSNTFENISIRWTGPVPFPLGPTTTTQDSVYWIAKSLANNTGSGTTLSTTKALDIPTGATIVAAISSENASMTCGGNCFTDSGSNYTFTMAAGNCNVALAANGAMMVGYVTNAVAHTGLTFTATTNASTFRNISVVVLSASTFDVCANGTTSAGSADVTTAAFTPTLNATVTQFGYITSGVALTSGTNYLLGNTSATTSFAFQLRDNVPASSQTGTLVQANTSSKWTVGISMKPAAGGGNGGGFRMLIGVGK